MRRVSLLFTLSLLAVSALVPSYAAHAQPPTTAGPAAVADWEEAHVTYVTEQTVYVDAGTAKGIAEGELFEVIRNANVVARLRALVVSSRKAACRREDGEAKIEVGDVVRFRSRPASKTTVTDSSGRTAPAAKDWSRRIHDLGISGRIGAHYNMTYQDSDFGYHQPGLDLRLRGRDIAGSGTDADVDVRAYRSYRNTGGDSSTDSRDRVYRANVAWTPETVPMRLSLGRQFSPALSSLSIFDGGAAEYTGERFSVGGIAGTQPDPDNYGFSSDIQEYGAYSEVRSKIGAERRWGGTLGLIGSYDGGEVNREYIYLQGRYEERGRSLWVAQEVDINRSWKKDAGESALTATSTYAYGRIDVIQNLSLSAGVDTRRDVRLYRDYVSPVTDFDDKYRSGYWVRIDGRYSWFRTGFDVRFSRGGSGGDADAYSVHVGAVRVTPLSLDLRSRTTRYDSEDAGGWLQHFTARMPIGENVGLSAQGGLRDETGKIDNGLDSQLGWYGFDVDVTLGTHWLYLLSLERTEGDDVGGYQLYTALSYRF